ncbi:LacI family transcriptional regulator [Enterococcus villorum]|uniref:LacI family transcriptional regulator n=1 Tax=Enterococcus villorum TaxID=112904 RepID=A0A1V8YNU1_9ENTE|nr:LacI family DNA-binding transcriptional regulator [Enterococcus villorum]OQO70551.1 LacI family transcriptional regulator [Enterococcus villorum]OQO74281.1 LacI family transcriptional regulator [Enterococcus villorum]
MTNIRDIAKLTGYSVSTVSRVINNHPYVDETKRAEILSVIKELEYVPNASARQLSYGRTKNIGVILPYTDHPYFDQLVSGIIEAAFNEDYKVTLLPTNYQVERERMYLEEFAGKRFDGLIVTSRANPLAVLLSYQKYGPIIFCEEIKETKASCVFINREESLKEALNYLKTQGVENLGVTLGRSGRLSYNSKITLEICKKIFPNFDLQNIFWNCIDYEQGVKAAKYFNQKKIDGVLSNTDAVAAAILQNGLLESKKRVIGRDNLLISKLLAFSTIDHGLRECGETAFLLFIEEKMEQIKIPYRFIQR